jgi:DNA-binding transcriptional ArsR family regulator
MLENKYSNNRQMAGTTTGSRGSTERRQAESGASREVMFDLLGNARRRRVLHNLLDEPEITLTDLSARIAAWENDTTVADLSSRQRKQVYSSLYQTHIPRLSDHDVVTYESDERIVRLTAAPDRLRRFLEVDQPSQTGSPSQWSRYFLWTAVVGSAVIAGNWLGTTPAAEVTTDTLYGLLTVAFMMLSVSFVMAVEGPKLLRFGD